MNNIQIGCPDRLLICEQSVRQRICVLFQVLNQAAIPKCVQVAAMPKRLELILVASSVVKIACMQRLMHVSHEVHNVFQRLEPRVIRGI